VRTSAPRYIGVIALIIRTVLAWSYLTGVRIDREARAKWGRRPRTRIVIAIHGLWLMQIEG
jgi:hypothetical protein